MESKVRKTLKVYHYATYKFKAEVLTMSVCHLIITQFIILHGTVLKEYYVSTKSKQKLKHISLEKVMPE